MAALSLESFERDAPGDDSAATAFNDGYQQGFEAGQAAAAADRTALASALVQSISDIDFSYAEARAQVMQSLDPLFEALTHAVLPHCITAGYTKQITNILSAAAAADTAGPFRLHVHPDQAPAVETETVDFSNKIKVISDSTLSPHAAWIQHGTGETHLDLDELLAQITDALGAVANPEYRTATNG